MKILVISQPLNNRGDESAHKALIRCLSARYPQNKIRVIYDSVQKEIIKPFIIDAKNVEYIPYTRKIKYDKFLKIFLWFKLVRFIGKFHPTIRSFIQEYKDADLIVCAPGGISMGGFQNWNHLFLLHLAKYTQKPLVYYGRSFGPFPTTTWKNRKFKKLSYEILNYFSYISVRDKKTEQLADNIGLKYTSTVDTAFLDEIMCDVPQAIKKFIKEKYVVFVPNLLVWHYNYKGRISKDTVKHFFIRLIQCVLNKYPNYQILMLPQTYGYRQSFKNDINFFHELKDLLNDTRIEVIPDIYSSDVQQEIIKNAEFVVGARYHSIVFAINNNVPFISLSYEHKMSGLLSSLGREDRMVDITHAMDNQENEEKSIALFKDKLAIIEKDPLTTRLAKEIAKRGLEDFCALIRDETQ